jgi:SAM-dependent methyltransferase
VLRKLVRKLVPGQDGRNPVVWPDLESEIGDWKKYLRGRCLNAGAGNRDLARFLDSEVVNQDIDSGLHNEAIDVYSPLHAIPFPDESFDCVVCNAVLEHVVNPGEVLDEFRRVLKREGTLYLCVPFLQPFHADPADYQRYTADGLRHLVESHGFSVRCIEPVHSIYHTLGWILFEWLRDQRGISAAVWRAVLFPLIRNRTRHSAAKSARVASAFRLIASAPSARP